MNRFVRTLALAAAPLVGACGLTDVVPDAEVLDSYVESLDMQSFQSLVVSDAAQVEVELLPGGLTARELEVRPSGASDEERVSSRAVSISEDFLGGRVGLLLGDLELGFDLNTRFWIGGDEVGMADFVGHVRAAIDGGFEPPIVAERPLPATPQAPDDSRFVARALAVTGEGHPSIRMEIDDDNLERVAAPVEGDPDGWLTLLGLRIQLRVSDGTTEVESHDHDFEDVKEFEGWVTSVDVDAMTFMIRDDYLVRLVDRSEIAQHDELIGTLQGVADAIGAGQKVIAWGKAAVESEDPPVLLGLKVAFAAKDAEEPTLEEFEGRVTEVATDAGTVALGDGTTVRVLEGTEIIAYDDHSPATLGAVSEALASGLEVIAWGKGTVESAEPLVLNATKVVFKAREPADHAIDFEGTIVEADPTQGVFVLGNGKLIQVGDETEVIGYNDHSPLTVEGIAAALENGVVLHAWGRGPLTGEDPYVVAAERVVIKTVLEDFEKDVVEIDVEGGVIVLEGGWVLNVTDDTSVTAADDMSPSTLQGALDTLEAGDRVRVWGYGIMVGHEPVTIQVVDVTMKRIEVG